jgi:hypothetical protein
MKGHMKKNAKKNLKKRPIQQIMSEAQLKKVIGGVGDQENAGTEYYTGEDYGGCSWTWTPFVG